MNTNDIGRVWESYPDSKEAMEQFSLYHARDAHRVEIKEDGKTIAISNVEDAATLARVINNVVPPAAIVSASFDGE